jgi:hypothetical protein
LTNNPTYVIVILLPMWYQFFLENLHFAVNLLAALIFFAIFWLYLDAWMGRKTFRESVRWIGFLLLSLSFLVSAASIETTVLQNSIIGKDWSILLLAITRIPGYLLIIYSLIIDPLQPKPKLGKMAVALALPKTFSLPAILIYSLCYPILAAVTGFLYLRRATIGLEDHLKTVALGFFILSISEFLNLFGLLRNTSNVDLYNLVASFGPIWIIATLMTLAAIAVMRGWVFSYLLKRMQSQLFMIFTTTIVVIFLLTTVSFTSLLLRNLENETLSRLETDIKVLSFAIDSKKAESLSDSVVLAQNPDVIALVEEKSRPKLNDIAQSYLLTKKQSFLVITSETGQVLARGEDRERVGDSLSNDPLVKRALLGQSASSVITKDGVLAPQISISSATPVIKEGVVLGAVMTGVSIDNAFVDGVKNATSLEASLYADNILSATTLLAQDGKARAVGIKEENKNIKENVLMKGQAYVGGLNMLNIPYFAAYLPLKDVDNIPVGMLSVSKLQSGVLEAAGRSIELTFIMTVILLVLSVFPALLIAKYLARQLK